MQGKNVFKLWLLMSGFACKFFIISSANIEERIEDIHNSIILSTIMKNGIEQQYSSLISLKSLGDIYRELYPDLLPDGLTVR